MSVEIMKGLGIFDTNSFGFLLTFYPAKKFPHDWVEVSRIGVLHFTEATGCEAAHHAQGGRQDKAGTRK
jgi:hypothetical protein